MAHGATSTVESPRLSSRWSDDDRLRRRHDPDGPPNASPRLQVRARHAVSGAFHLDRPVVRQVGRLGHLRSRPTTGARRGAGSGASHDARCAGPAGTRAGLAPVPSGSDTPRMRGPTSVVMTTRGPPRSTARPACPATWISSMRSAAVLMARWYPPCARPGHRRSARFVTRTAAPAIVRRGTATSSGWAGSRIRTRGTGSTPWSPSGRTGMRRTRCCCWSTTRS